MNLSKLKVLSKITTVKFEPLIAFHKPSINASINRHEDTGASAIDDG